MAGCILAKAAWEDPTSYLHSASCSLGWRRELILDRSSGKSLCSWDQKICRDKSDYFYFEVRGGLQVGGALMCWEGPIGEIVLESMDLGAHYGWRSRTPSSRAVMIATKLVAVSGS